jgi:ABC-type antimicrobial peptide transport system permease subunit
LGITGLSLGFLCFSVIVFDIEWQTGYDTEYPGAGRMYILRTEYRSDYNGNIYSLTQALPEIEKMTVCGKEDGQKSYTLSELSDTAKSQRYRLMLGECDTAFIDFFSLKILAGNRYSINRTVNGIVLFDTKAKQMNENIHSLIGTSFQSGDEIFQIAGIVKRPVNSRINFGDGFIINRLTGIFKDEIYNRWNDEYRTFIMLKNSVPEKKFKETLSNRQFSFTLYGDQGMRKNADGDWIKVTPNDEDERFTVKPLNDLLEYKSVTDYLSKFFIGLLVLLTTLFNYTSFQTSVFYNRLKECALRRTAGAGKKDLFFLFFTEIIIAFIITYFVSILLLDLFKGYITEHGFYLPDLNLVRISMLRYLLFVLLIASVLYAIPINVIHRMSIRSVFLGISQKGKKERYAM